MSTPRTALVNLGDSFAGRTMYEGGPFALWVHGYTLDSTCWTGLWHRLPGWRHVGLDLPSHGYSLPLKPAEDLSTLAKRIGAVALRLDARHLVAHSFGTIVAVQTALECPGVLSSLTLAAPVLGGGPIDPDVWMRYAHLKTLIAEGGDGSALRDNWMAPDASLFRGSERHPDLLNDLRRQVGRHPWWELFDDSYSRLWQTPMRLMALRDIGLPTLVLVGEDDSEAVKRCAYFLERLIPSCQRQDLAGLGHMCLLEAPADVSSIIEQHWQAHPAPATVTQEVSYGDAARD